MSDTEILHLTSEEAFCKGNNVFVWRTIPSNSKIVLSWRIDKDLPMTHKDMYRWVDQTMEDHFSLNGMDAPEYSIYPVMVSRSRTTPLTHNVERTSGRSGSTNLSLSRDSLEKLKPGSYGLYTANGTPSRSTFPFGPKRSVHRYKTSLHYSSDLVSQSYVREELRAQVKARDGRKCCLTGVELAENDLDMIYIIPPWLAHLTMDHDNDIRVSMTFREPTQTPADLAETLKISSNCLTMSKRVIQLFEKSIIAIDVDDNHRVVRFYKGDEIDAALKYPLESSFDPKDEKIDRFLRVHFLYSLSVQVHGGDFQDNYTRSDVRRFMTELGLFEDNGREYSLRGGDYSTGEWTSELGQQLLAWFKDSPYKPWEVMYVEGFGIGPPEE